MILTDTGEAQVASLHAIIIKKIRDVARQQSIGLAPLSDDLPLMESGLDSLCIAVIVAGLDDELGRFCKTLRKCRTLKRRCRN